jgi:hypothetical protein
MPAGQPDPRFDPEPAETLADRIIREAMEAGEFDDLPGLGKPIPGAGTVDDEMWWVRSWVERNHEPPTEESSNDS